MDLLKTVVPSLYSCAVAHAFSLLEESNLTGAKVSKALPDLEVKAEGDSSMDGSAPKEVRDLLLRESAASLRRSE